MSDDTIIVLCPIVHEKQSFQFCALHSLNNLLQLSSSNYNTTIEYENNKTKDGCSNNNNNNKNGLPKNVVVGGIKDCHRWNHKFPSIGDGKMEPFTKNELDRIANRFISAESKLFNNTNDGSILEENDDSSPHVSFLQSLRSNHRTPLTGNYSYEVSKFVKYGYCISFLKKNFFTNLLKKLNIFSFHIYIYCIRACVRR